MYMASGDCLVYFSEDSSSHNEPRPMLRVHVDKLQEARSSFLSNLVTYGEIEQDDYSPPPSVSGSANSPPAYPLTTSNLGYLDENTVSPTREAPERGMMSPTRPTASRSVRSSGSAYGGNHLLRNPRLSAFPTPPRSRTQSDVASSADLNNQEVDVTHEIWFPAPSYIKTPHAQRRHHLATRNFLALLYDKPIVGADLFEMLSELQMVMDIMYELNEPNRRPNTAALIVDYLVGRRLDDVRGSLTNALSLLAWSEKLDVGWDQGYLEAFVHAVGMLTRNALDRPEFKRLSPVTRHNLEKSYNGMQIKILNAEEKLGSFAFPELWHLPNVVANSPAFRASESFRDWLKTYFSSTYEQWPAKVNQHGHWVTRELVHKLQEDFGAIYDVLVNRDIIWTDNEARHTRKWEMASKTALTDIFSPDLPGMPITDMLISFDNQHAYQHIPHPYPLLPRRVPSLTAAPTKKKKIFGIGKKDKAASSPRDPSEHMKISLAFGDATNINKLGMLLETNDLRDAFLEYEKTATTDAIPTADARLGRWLLLYGLLQALSTLSVDTDGIKYKTDVSYFLCPSLENCPPWPPARSLVVAGGARRVPSAAAVREADQRRSWCWVAPLRWEGGGAAAVELGGESATRNVGDGDVAAAAELDGRLLNDRDRKLRMLQFEQKLLAQRQAYDEYERRYGGLRLGGGEQPPQRPPSRSARGAEEKEYLGDTERGRGERREGYGGYGGGGRPDLPLRSPLRSPPPPLRGAREKDVPRRMMEFFVEDDEEDEVDGADGEGRREGEALPGYAR